MQVDPLEYYPTVHTVGAAPPGQDDPAGQGIHASYPVAGVYVPAAQAVADVDPVGQ